MKKFHVHFLEPWADDFCSLTDSDKFPEAPGAYVMGSADGTVFQYPWGTSPIYYIGKSDNLWQRLSEHKRHTSGAEEDYYQYWWPRYQYGAAFGSDIAVYLANSNDKSSDQLERELIEGFWEVFGSIPVANGAWPKVLDEPKGDEDDA